MRVVVDDPTRVASVRRALAIAGISATVVTLGVENTVSTRPTTVVSNYRDSSDWVSEIANIRMRYNARGRRWRPFPDLHFPLVTRVSDREFFTCWFRRARRPDHLPPATPVGPRARGFSRARGGRLRHHFRRRRHTTRKAPKTRCSFRSHRNPS